MSDGHEIRTSTEADRPVIEALYREAFPDEDLLPLVRALLDEGEGTCSLVAEANASLLGHIVFTHCRIAGQTDEVALLGPLAVMPAQQRRGIGGALVKAGFNRLREVSIPRVCVLGDPVYYGRFGFLPERSVNPPYPLPDPWKDAWQSCKLDPNAPSAKGLLVVPEPWRQPTLWGP